MHWLLQTYRYCIGRVIFQLSGSDLSLVSSVNLIDNGKCDWPTEVLFSCDLTGHYAAEMCNGHLIHS
ncbi:hypothetical protein T4D_7555 [Trichinella pseudospiralis]|uniref:Uncharacterized protein n=1 Tax=Trichinella pseudospiralis TaxID=6337 RepID=A0A0V1FI75_TRIPS|nr:hypothetical protein T4D_7555 [Trichinella pseudospiralis]